MFRPYFSDFVPCYSKLVLREHFWDLLNFYRVWVMTAIYNQTSIIRDASLDQYLKIVNAPCDISSLLQLYFILYDNLHLRCISIKEGCRWSKYFSAKHIYSTHLFNCDEANISFIFVVHFSCLLVMICARLLTGKLLLKIERSLLLLWTNESHQSLQLIVRIGNIFQYERPNNFLACLMYFQNKPSRLDTFSVLVNLTCQPCNLFMT